MQDLYFDSAENAQLVLADLYLGKCKFPSSLFYFKFEQFPKKYYNRISKYLFVTGLFF